MITLEQYERAERELTFRESRRGWTIHVAIYAAVVTALTALNVLLVLATDAGFFWFPFPMVGWGIGVAMHYVFGVRSAERQLREHQATVERYAHDLATSA